MNSAVIHLTNSPEGGGAERLVAQLKEKLADAGCRVEVIYLQGGGGKASLGCRRVRNLLGILPAAWKTLCLLRRHRGAILHAHLFPANYIAAIFAFFGAPVVVTEHNTKYGRRDLPILSVIDGWVYSVFKRVICISAGVRDALTAKYPYLRERCAVVHNGIDVERFRFGRPPIANRLPVAGMVCRLSHQKNVDGMLRAVHRCREAIGKFLIVGAGEEQERIERVISELGLTAIVELRPFTDQPEAAYREIDIFCLVSRWEGFGLTAVEAMAAECALLASRVAGLQEIVHGANRNCAAVCVDPESTESIVAGLMELCEHPELRRKLTGIGSEIAGNFSIERMVASYMKIYREIEGAQ